MKTFNYFDFFFKEGIKNIQRNSSVTFISVTLITVSIFIIGIMFSLSNTLRAIIGNISDSPAIIFFLKDNCALAEKEELIYKMRQTPNVLKVEFYDRNDAYTLIEEDETIKGLVDIYGKEIIPESIAVFTGGSVTTEDIKAVHDKYIDDPSIDTGLLQSSISDILLYIDKMGHIIFIIFSILVILIVGNAIRLSVFAKEQEIVLKRLIGATESFIRVPFMVEGILKGLAGGTLAALLFIVILIFRDSIFPSKFFSSIKLLTVAQSASLILIGGGFGCLGSIISAKVYIK